MAQVYEYANSRDKHSGLCTERYLRACSSILSPSLAALKLTLKPKILGAVSMGCFKVPPYLVLTSKGIYESEEETSTPVTMMSLSGCDSTCDSSYDLDLNDTESRGQLSWPDSMLRMHAFCERVGYPVLLKGDQNGCGAYYSWSALAHKLTAWQADQEKDLSGDTSSSASSLPCRGEKERMGRSRANLFLQKHIPGAEKTIAFGAIQGELTGAVTMTKYIHTRAGKVWAGTLSAVSDDTMQRLEQLVEQTEWTGGGEIEFIETETNEWYVIDFNPRLPAWIMATCYAGCNLPADLLAHAVSKQNGTSDLFFRSGDYSRVSGQFTRSVIELPQCHYAVHRQSQELCSRAAFSKRAGGSGSTTHTRSLVRLVAKTVAATVAANGLEADSDDSSSLEGASPGGLDAPSLPVTDKTTPSSSVEGIVESTYISEWISRICRTASAVIKDAAAADTLNSFRTPHYILNRSSVLDSLQNHKQFVAEARDMAGLATSLNLCMCVSVKTQPHRSVLKLALEAGYLAECISLAEVYTALDVGFSMHSIILTGPGKFWVGRSHRHIPRGPMTLRAIFADSLADLRTIVTRVCDPEDDLCTTMVGVRFMPICGPRSRFGLDCSDPAVLLAAAHLIRLLPENIRLGVHFHYASSGPGSGLPLWRGLVKGMATLARHFGELCSRSVRVVDIGGGWSPSFIEQPRAKEEVASLLRHIYCEFIVAKVMPEAIPLTIQFEPGKSISERAGGILCRVLCVREIPCHVSVETLDSTDTNACKWECMDKQGTLSLVRRAVIVDACLGDVSSPHIHPVMWLPAARNTSSQQQATPVNEHKFMDTSGIDSNCSGWVVLSAGLDQIWGRSCMEFDVFTSQRGDLTAAAGIKLPKHLQEGDFLLLAATGAYDMSMQYDFGDGKERACSFVDQE